MQKVIQQIMPFIFFGIALVALSFGLVLLLYLIAFGTIIGAVLFLFRQIKFRFSSSKQTDFKRESKPDQKKGSGRIIDSDEWRKL